MEAGIKFKFMNNFLKKFVVLFVLGFILFGFDFVIAEDVPPLKENFIIKNGGSVIWQGEVDLPSPDDVVISGQNVNNQSVLAVLNSIDSNTESFSISDLSYNNDYNSFLLNCITPLGASPLCYNWQYVVNGSYPQVGMDKTMLVGNETIYLYFGPQNKVSLNKNSITDEEELTVTALKYNFDNDSWSPRPDVTVGVTKPTDIPFSPNDDIKSKVDDSTGVAHFSAIPVGEYDVGIKEDYYWPTEKLIVTKAVHESHGSSGSYIQNFIKPIIVPKTFSVENALKFLEINQKSDGSYGAPMYTDWVAIAVGVGDYKEIKLKLINYLKEDVLDSSIITDNERRAMALMSLGINPYSGTSVNYIKKITDSFDGTQFGDKTLVNDDIFALIVLKNAGYSVNDELITKDLNYIISKQNKDGSWGSVDMTAAGIQALKSFENIAGVNDVISKAEKYITTNQKIDGGFENISSTSWVLQTLFADKEILKTEGYLASKQDIDGGMESIGSDLNTRIWTTAYTIPAILHKPWSIILNNFSKPDISTLVLNKNEVIKQNRKVDPKISNINSVELIKSTEDKKKIENIVDSSLEVKNNKSSNIWGVLKAPFSWLLGKLGF